MKVDRFFPKQQPKFTLTFTRDEGWALVMALKDAAERYHTAADCEEWRRWAADLDKELRR